MRVLFPLNFQMTSFYLLQAVHLAQNSLLLPEKYQHFFKSKISFKDIFVQPVWDSLTIILKKLFNRIIYGIFSRQINLDNLTSRKKVEHKIWRISLIIIISHESNLESFYTESPNQSFFLTFVKKLTINVHNKKFF